MTKQRERSYDEKCYELAKYFLADRSHTSEELADLAQTIQDAVENWRPAPEHP
jgi:hypothetical protein